MENSFSEYRDKTGVESDEEFIDNSVQDDSLAFLKTPGKNKTAFVAESESNTDDESEEEQAQGRPVVQKLFLRKSSLIESHVLSSSDDDASKHGSNRKQSEMSFNKVVLSSSDEEGDVSPEIVPKRRPPMRPKSTDSSETSFIGRKKNKRMILMDSDTENSIVFEKEKQKKQPCLKATPFKIERSHSKKVVTQKSFEDSVMDDSNEGSDEEESASDESEQSDEDLSSASDEENKNNAKKFNTDNNELSKKESHEESHEKHEGSSECEGSEAADATDEEEPDEDEMVYSRATRMSIMGIIAKDNDSDDSDFIQSDEQSRGSSVSISDQSNIPIEKGNNLPKTPDKSEEDIHNDTTRLSCSPFTSPFHDRTNTEHEIVTNNNQTEKTTSKSNIKEKELTNSNVKNNKAIKKYERKSAEKNNKSFKNRGEKSLTRKENTTDEEVTFISSNKELNNDQEVTFVSSNKELTNDQEVTFVSSNKEFKSFSSEKKKETSYKESVIDEDITIIDSKPEVIALSSDDDEGKSPKRTPKKSPRAAKEVAGAKAGSSKGGTLKTYLVPPSYPNQVMYVKRHVRENELKKLEQLREDLQSVKYIFETMDLESLPDCGKKLMERYNNLEREVRAQGDKVAAMIVEPEEPSAEQMHGDGFGAASSYRAPAQRAEPTWEDIQKASNAVQPRMFGKQAMATHMAERNLILERLRDLHQSMASCPPESEESAAPSALRSELMPHQKHALAWLQWRETQRPPAGILADDMGLGKTITMIALILTDKEKNISYDSEDEEWNGKAHSKLSRGGTLVVCPASLIQQWAGEVAKHCASYAASVCLHHGANRAEHPHRLSTYDIVVTTYNILQRDHDKGVLFKILWRRIILDEAHIVRNHKSITSQAVSALKGSRRWCLTGTPVQNKDLDLFALLKFLRCTPFDDLAMWKKWIDNKSLGGEERLNTIMRCVLLRRTKAQLQARGLLGCLPARGEVLVEVALTRDEMNVYQKVLVFSKTLFAQFLKQRAERQADGDAALAHRNTAYDKMHKRMIALQGAKPVKSHEILVLLLRLRQVCCHCGLIAAMLDDEDEAAGDLKEDLAGKDLLDELDKLSLEDGKKKRRSGQHNDLDDDDDKENQPEEGTSVREAIRSVLSPHNPVFRLDTPSSKIKQVMACLKENVFKNKDDKAVVVSQWTAVLRLVESELRSVGVRSVTLSGEVPVPQRPPIIAKLNDPHNDVKVMLLSLCAGGVGLNLCGANHLLLLDPHWNPQLEQQAQDRVYRVGQTKPVHIYRFMCVDTVEQSIRKLQQAKLDLAESVLTGARNNASKLSIEDLKVLFNM